MTNSILLSRKGFLETTQALLAGAVGAIALAVISAPIAQAFPIASPGTEGLEVVVGVNGPVVATYQGNSASFSNDLYLMLDGSGNPGDDGILTNDLFIFNNQASPVGSTVTLGSFSSGTELIFRLFVNNTSNNYFTGPASRNPDGGIHARVQGNWQPNESLVSFEDLFNGPFVYNDLSFSFTNTASTTDATATPEPTSVIGLLGFGTLGLVLKRKKKSD